MGKRKKQVKCSICHLKGKISRDHCKKCGKHHKLSETCAKSLAVDYFEPKKKIKTLESETSKDANSICIIIEESNSKSKDNRKKSLNQKSSTTNYKISNNFKKMDHYFKSTSKNILHTEKKKQVLTSTYLKDSQKKYTKGRDSITKVSISQNRKDGTLTSEKELKVKFYFHNDFDLLVPVSEENQLSQIWFENFGNINNMHLLDPPGDGDCFFILFTS